MKIDHFKPTLLSPQTTLKECFKSRYKFKIAIFAGINLFLLFASRDLASIFFTLNLFFAQNEENKILTQIYLIPNIFFPLLFGYITDYAGYHFGLLALHLPIILGNFFILMSTNEKPFNLECAIVGRFLYSIGGESLQIILLTIVVNYFRKEQRTSFGLIICLSISYFGFSMVNLSVIIGLLRIDDQNNVALKKPAILALISAFLSFLTSISIVLFEKYWDKILSKTSQYDLELKNQPSFLNEAEIYPYSFWQAFQKVLTCRILLVCLMNGLMWGSFFCMINYNKYFFNMKEMNIIELQLNLEVYSIGLYILIAISCYFFIGNYIDNYKQRNFFMMFGCLLNAFSYIIFSITYKNYIPETNVTLIAFFVIIGSVTLSIGMGAFIAAVNSAIPFLVKEKNLTIGFGIMYSIMNLFKFLLISITPSIANGNNYFWGKNPFWIFCCFSVVLAVILEFIERNNIIN